MQSVDKCGVAKTVFYVRFFRVQMLSDESIVKELHVGNRKVFRELYDRFYVPLRAFAGHYMEDDAASDDFVQDAFLKLWEMRLNFEQIPAIKSFLYTHIRNACLNHIKHLRVCYRNKAELQTLFSEESERNFILEEEVHRRVYEVIQDLSEQSRRVVLMSMEGLTNAEIAVKLDISQNTVKTIKLRAYKVLRERLDGLHWVLFLLFLS